MRWWVTAIAIVAASGTAHATDPTEPPAASSNSTDFGIRVVGGARYVDPALKPISVPAANVDMKAISALGAQWGVVTSTYRTPAHNRRVGGVRNSYHLKNRAIDIARRPGVRHSQIAAAYRKAGYRLIESLDEGDHSHFAFGGPQLLTPQKPVAQIVHAGSKPTEWRIVFAPPSKSAN